MKTKVLKHWMGVRTGSNWAAAIVCIASLTISTPVWAGNPWGRAVGEAQGLHDVTEDLRNRASRLFPGSPATRLACALDESACQLLEMVKCGADWGQLQAALQSFQELNAYLCRAVSADCHVSRDRAIANYLRMVDDRFGDLVRDLSKCKPPIPTCRTPHATPYYPSLPQPYPYSGYRPSIPQPIPAPWETYHFDPRFVKPNVHPSIPPQWQGSMPRALR